MPTEERGEIGSVKPSGWHSIKYDCVDGKYLYNRCHLVGFQLAGENANDKNLVTGTRYLNIDGMLYYENLIADYVRNSTYTAFEGVTSNHVLYRVTPVFIGDELVCRGLLLEAKSIEDNGKGIQFCIYAYNVQPGITIDYATGDSYLSGENIPETTTYAANPEGKIYILNTSSKKYHTEDCIYGAQIKDYNRETFNGTIEWLTDHGYVPCKSCNSY